jgi:hypothetical protein
MFAGGTPAREIFVAAPRQTIDGGEPGFNLALRSTLACGQSHPMISLAAATSSRCRTTPLELLVATLAGVSR